jgi:hypothetical protein
MIYGITMPIKLWKIYSIITRMYKYESYLPRSIRRMIQDSACKASIGYRRKKEETLTKQALDDWYLAEQKDYGTFASKYPMNGELKNRTVK